MFNYLDKYYLRNKGDTNLNRSAMSLFIDNIF